MDKEEMIKVYNALLSIEVKGGSVLTLADIIKYIGKKIETQNGGE